MRSIAIGEIAAAGNSILPKFGFELAARLNSCSLPVKSALFTKTHRPIDTISDQKHAVYPFIFVSLMLTAASKAKM
jgi:hypothetical protein